MCRSPILVGSCSSGPERARCFILSIAIWAGVTSPREASRSSTCPAVTTIFSASQACGGLPSDLSSGWTGRRDPARRGPSLARRQKLQFVLFRDLHHPRNVLLLLGSERPNLFEEALKACRCDDAHEPAGRLAEVAVSMGDAARRENRFAFLG